MFSSSILKRVQDEHKDWRAKYFKNSAAFECILVLNEEMLDEVMSLIPEHMEGAGPIKALLHSIGRTNRAYVKSIQNIRGGSELWQERLKEELGDVGIAWLGFIDMLGWDAEEILNKRWETVKIRDIYDER